MKKLLTYSLLLCCLGISRAQQEPEKQVKDKDLPRGNQAFENKEFAKAEADYRVSQSKFPNKSIASYNLGNSIYKLKQPTEAKFAYANAIKNAKTRPEKHQAFHNLGNTLMDSKDYQGAVAAYKQALVNDPSDEQTRYNYALARKMLKDNPPPPPKDDKKKDKDKEKDKKDDKDKKDKPEDKEKEKDKNKKDQNQDKDQDKGDQPQKPQPRPGGISQQRMENLLDAVNNEEKKVQDKVKARQQKGKPVKTEKDW